MSQVLNINNGEKECPLVYFGESISEDSNGAPRLFLNVVLETDNSFLNKDGSYDTSTFLEPFVQYCFENSISVLEVKNGLNEPIIRTTAYNKISNLTVTLSETDKVSVDLTFTKELTLKGSSL